MAKPPKPREDRSLDNLLDLDGEVLAMGGGFRVEIKARKVGVSPQRPHGIDYSLCLIGPDDERAICFDNAHPVVTGSGPSKRRTAVNDHVHGRKRIRPYAYTDAATLLEDFWDAVDAYLKEEGVP